MSYYSKSLNIPEVEKTELVESYDRVAKHRLNPDVGDIKYLFAQFNRYFAPTPTDIYCADCRRAIFDYWKNTITQWRRDKVVS